MEEITMITPTLRALNPQEKELYAQVRLASIQIAPYIADALFRAHPVAVDGLGKYFIAASDRYWRIYLNFTQFSTDIPGHSTGFLANILLHEIWHLLRNHCQPHPGYEQHYRANIAMDLEINDDIDWKISTSQHDRPVFSSDFDLPEHQTWQYYYANMKEKNLNRLRFVCNGGSAIGQSLPWEIDPNHPDFPAINELEAAGCRSNVAREASKYAKLNGDDRLGAWAKEQLHGSTVNWREHLQACFRKATVTFKGYTDYTMRRPARRTPPGTYLPSMITHKPRVAVAFDISGSMGEGEGSPIQRVASEVQGLLRRTGISEIYACQVDTEQRTRFEKVRDLTTYMFGRGGSTDMGAAFEAAKELQPAPNILLVCTDGMTPWPDSPPLRNVEYLTLIVTAGGKVDAETLRSQMEIPSWIKVIPAFLDE